MPNDYVEPTFDSVGSRLLFLSRLYGVPITAQDVQDFQAWRDARPVKRADETWVQFKRRVNAWRDERYAHPPWFVISKWFSYRLGKVQPSVANYLSTRPTPTLAQARFAVRLQLEAKYAAEIATLTPSTDLLPLVTGLVW